MIWLAIALQATAAATPAPAPDAPQRWSILTPQPCMPQADKTDIVVCADGTSSQTLPLPDEIGPPPGRGANRDLKATTALALEAPPCAATLRGCTVGFGPPIVPLVGALAKVAKSAFAKKPDKRGRVAIDLSTP
ncbi:MAG: hypothetical protein EOP65_08305 [Sphingomonas sp.]|nr:MAG: hypothetical protein EOP65_08305 [Sphingomonas sp.]